MASHTTDRKIAIAMGVAPLAGILLSVLTSDVSGWDTITRMFVAISLLISAMAFFYAITGRSVIGKLPTDPEALRRVKTLSMVVLASVALIVLFELVTALAGSWGSADGMLIGIYAAIAVMFTGRLAAIRAQESAAS